MSGYDNTTTGTGQGIGQKIKQMVPGTTEHKMANAGLGQTGGMGNDATYDNTMGGTTGMGNTSGNTGNTMANVKSHIPGTTEHQMKQGTGMTGGYDTVGANAGVTGTGMGQAGMGPGAGTGHHHGHHHGAEAAGAGALGGAMLGEHEHHKHHTGHENTMSAAGGVDTPNETMGEKIKKHLPGTEEHKIHKANKDDGVGGGMGGMSAY